MTHAVSRVCASLAVVGASLLSLLRPSVLLAQTEIAIVAEYAPATARFSIQRGSPSSDVPLKIGSLLQDGDVIALPASAKVTLQFADGTIRVLNGPSRTVITPTRSSFSIPRAFARVSALFDPNFRQARTAATRGTTDCIAGTEAARLEIPLLTNMQYVVRGTRDIPLVWQGGCAPFAVRLMRGRDTVFQRIGIRETQLRTDRVALTDGSYRLVIVDARGAQAEAQLVPQDAMPEAAATNLADTTAFAVIARAVTLAELDLGRWRLEAFELLRPLIRAGNPLAGSLGDALLWGKN